MTFSGDRSGKTRGQSAKVVSVSVMGAENGEIWDTEAMPPLCKFCETGREKKGVEFETSK